MLVAFWHTLEGGSDFSRDQKDESTLLYHD